jgi:hypothetical protein
MNNRDEILNLKEELGTIAADARKEFGGLSAAQLNWKPSADRWSVGQCLNHLITSNTEYFPILDSLVSGKKKTVFLERLPVLPKLWGKLMIKSLDPKTTRKLKAPANLQPASSDLSTSVVEQFVEQQSKFADWMDKTKDLDLERIVITSPVMKLITYSVMDSYRFLVLHEQRHFQQAQRVMTEANFPK